jgi:hypothetical protein
VPDYATLHPTMSGGEKGMFEEDEDWEEGEDEEWEEEEW